MHNVNRCQRTIWSGRRRSNNGVCEDGEHPALVGYFQRGNDQRTAGVAV